MMRNSCFINLRRKQIFFLFVGALALLRPFLPARSGCLAFSIRSIQKQKCQHNSRIRVYSNLQDSVEIPPLHQEECKYHDDDNRHYRDESCSSTSRRRFAIAATTGGMSALLGNMSCTAAAMEKPFTPAIRPLSYRVDSTIPPTLLPVQNEQQILKKLGRFSGTDKDAIVVDTINLNNMLNKAVFGTAELFFGDKQLASPNSFVCLGIPNTSPSPTDMQLALKLMAPMTDTAPSSAIAMAVFPYTTQSDLDAYIQNEISSDTLRDRLSSTGVSLSTVERYRPILEWARSRQISILAAAVTVNDRQSVLQSGLQSLDPNVRNQYVADTQGFIDSVNDPAFQLYTDRSLLKDILNGDKNDNNSTTTTTTKSSGNYFADRILCHEATATRVARYAISHPDTLLVVLAPTSDVRYLRGINGRIPRVYNSLQTTVSTAETNRKSTISMNDVTTILLNPNPADTLSKTRRLRLEIGTGPETLEFQTKVADYLWFYDVPPVSLIPRLMNG